MHSLWDHYCSITLCKRFTFSQRHLWQLCAQFIHTVDFVDVIHLKITLYICEPFASRLFLHIYNVSTNLHIRAGGFARIMAPIPHLLFVYVFVFQAHTHTHSLTCTFSVCWNQPMFSSSVVWWCSWSTGQTFSLPTTLVFCLGSRVFLLRNKRHCDFSCITSALTPTRPYFFITLSFCVFASLPLLFVFPPLSPVLRWSVGRVWTLRLPPSSSPVTNPVTAQNPAAWMWPRWSEEVWGCADSEEKGDRAPEALVGLLQVCLWGCQATLCLGIPTPPTRPPWFCPPVAPVPLVCARHTQHTIPLTHSTQKAPQTLATKA